jgi:formylglycine-generating enzyme required for sulfatase activity
MSESPVEIPGFRIERELGRGASGVVYLARELALGREVALKVLRAGVSHAPEVRARFEREVRSAARVSHPNIVPVLATGESGGRLWYTMERIDGPSLDKVLADAPMSRLPPARAARIVLDVGRVLAAAHAVGVTHRDVKPANVVLLREPAPSVEVSSATRRHVESWIEKVKVSRHQEPQVDRPRLMDFGLASDASAARLSESGMLIGTPAYMAPEQFRARSGEVGPAADQWALGVMLYELLTGHLPFPVEDLPTLARLVAEAAPVPPTRLDPRIDKELETICLTCLEKAPGDRYASVDALVHDLERWLAEEPIQARPPGLARRMRAWGRRRPRLVTALAAVVVAGLGLLAYEVWTARERTARRDDLAQRARTAEAQGRWPDAEAAYESWLALEPGQADARDGRERARAVQAALAAESAYRDAVRKLDGLRANEREVEALVKRAEQGATAPGGAGLGLGQARGSEPWAMREPAFSARIQAEARASALVLERAAVEQALGVALASAESAAPRAGPEGERVRSTLRAGLARWHLEEWRRSQVLGDADQAARHRLAVERLEPGAHDEELGATGTLTLALGDAGAEVWLFRYLREADLLPRGGPRLLPVPWRVAAPSDGPGEAGGARIPAPYVTALAERLAEDADRPPAPDNPAPASAVADDAQHVGTAQGRLRRARYVERRDGTAYPLDTGAWNALLLRDGRTTVKLPAGRYLLLVRGPGRLETRLPCEVVRAQEVRLAPGRLPSAGALPGGFVAVVASEAPVDMAPAEPLLVERLEVTFAQWWEFLDDPRTRAEIERMRPQEWRFVPRTKDGPLSRAGPDGRFEPVGNPSRPVAHVSLYDLVGYPEPPEGESEPLDYQVAELADALARNETIGWGYLAWRNARSRERAAARARDPRAESADVALDAAGVPRALRFSLPTAAEWEQAADGRQTRRYPFGDEFDWAYVKGGRSRRTNPVPEPVGLFPDDESPYGVRDLAGSLAEWTATWNEKGKTFDVRGGSWDLTDPAAFALTTPRTALPRLTSPTLGVRVVVRLTVPLE